METLTTFFADFMKEILFFYNEISIYLIFGFFIAGVLHIFFPESIIRKHLGNNTLLSVVKSTLFGIPIPLCSCGVVPVAASLRNSGASKGATISFLIATPQVGADSFLITYSLLGWIFAFFRITASVITSLTAGIIVNLINIPDDDHKTELPLFKNHEETFAQRMKNIFTYIELDLLGSLANALIGGIIVAGIIGAVIPEGFLEQSIGSGFLSMFLMLIVGIPMYVCASASTPIAASLIMKGLSPGAALVFLLTGPATNAVTITTVTRTLGKKTAFVYIASISFVSIALGYVLNTFAYKYGIRNIIMIHEHDILPEWIKSGGSIILTLMLSWYYIKTRIFDKTVKRSTLESRKIHLNVEGMTCMHCAGNVRKALESINGITDIEVNLSKKIVEFNTEKNENIGKAKAAIINAGYAVTA